MLRYVTILFAFALSIGVLPVFFGAESAQAVSVSPREGFRDTPVVRSAGQPVALAFTPDGRMIVADKPGRLRVYGTDGRQLANPALDLTGKVCTGERSPGRQDERGLLGVAVDPYFETNRYVYVYYTYKKYPNAADPCPYGDPDSPVNRVSRFKMSGSTVLPGSEAVLVDNIPSTSGSHNAGDLQVGKDGNLYVSIGDGGCDYAATRNCAGLNDAAQDPHALVGKILRVTRGGAIPQGNPYTGAGTERCGDRADDGRTDPGKKCQEVFATGLRNPFRMAFDPDAASTRFFINDVGQFGWEEIDIGRRGANYGWNLCEGRHDNPDRPGAVDCAAGPYTPPLHEYNHNPQPDGSECRSITGGAFVPNDASWPASYRDSYLFGDYICNKIFALTPRKGGGFVRTTFVSRLDDFGPIAMSFGPAAGSGEALYYTTFANGGEIRRISFVG